jgi:hypothetical protein
MSKPIILCLALLMALLGACKGNDHAPDAAPPDAPLPDAAGPDGAVTEACDVLCDCLFNTICVNDVDGDHQQCLQDCAPLPASVKSCRITHCGYAEAGLGQNHCLHALGDRSDPDTPAECVAPDQ